MEDLVVQSARLLEPISSRAQNGIVVEAEPANLKSWPTCGCGGDIEPNCSCVMLPEIPTIANHYKATTTQ